MTARRGQARLPGRGRAELAAGLACQRFEQDFNCAECVLATVAEQMGIKSSLIPAVATGFGAGMGRRGSVCGAVAGAVMALGLKYGRLHPKQSRLPTYRRVQALCRRFEEKYGSIFCRDLIGHDISSARALNRAMRAGVFATRCPEFIASAVKLYFELAQ
ncbi:C_GCAxxG_C_C family protein [candidate division WOR-3 bacterium]|nr:C_GCAxxG_C_C family protein [candidate division WOR-3 bacterium]